jgi:hypothetical protein
MIRSVLIAGMHDEKNKYTRYCEDLWLKWEHLPELRNSHVPTKHDATIIAASIASHTLYHAVRDAYKSEGKPVFLSKEGISEIKEDFEREVFGSEHIIKKLREPTPDGVRQRGALSISARFWWVLSAFKQPGDEIKLQDIVRFFDKFIMKDEQKALAQVWYRGRHDDCLEDVEPGIAIFKGVPRTAIETIKSCDMWKDDDYRETMPRPNIVIRKPAPAALIEAVESEPITKVQYAPEPQVSETNASLELLLESMASQQEAITALQTMIEKRIPEIIQNEIKGITVLLGSLVPKLEGLTPEQLTKVDQMIDLFLSMR